MISTRCVPISIQVRNPSLHNSGKRVMHDCASILDSIAKGISLLGNSKSIQ